MTSIAERLMDPSKRKAMAREIRRRRRGQNVAFRREDGRLDCFSYNCREKAIRIAKNCNGVVV